MSLSDYRKVTLAALNKAAHEAAARMRFPVTPIGREALAAIFVTAVLLRLSLNRHHRDLLTMARDAVRLPVDGGTITERTFAGWLEDERKRHDAAVKDLAAQLRRLSAVAAYRPVIAAAEEYMAGLGPKVWFDVPRPPSRRPRTSRGER